ncbi:MAG: hypothetical protein D6752_05725 [Candidatus Nitrosothermus koennekii]|nr:MAG: hypothetical protein D6752_05725 [Candidatus Nitrosothermus koennekii]
MSYEEIDKDIFVNHLELADALILDCDGTLVNINRSYNACIKYTVGFMLELLSNKRWYDYVTDDLIQAFRATGGFNNDIDTCYACILAAVASNTDDIDKAREFAFKIAERSDARGIVSVEEQLSDIAIKDKLNYPSSNSLLTRAFDEFFYGRELFKEIYKQEPRFNDGKGFIEYDELIINNLTIDAFKNSFDDRLAIVSGRSRIATEYALKDMLDKFNLEASVFIEDEERNAMKNNLSIKVGKPEPYSIIRSMKAMEVDNAICIGDSVEDLIMSRNAMKHGYEVQFIGIYDNGLDAIKQLSIFKDKHADAIVRDINLVPRLLEAIC